MIQAFGYDYVVSYRFSSCSKYSDRGLTTPESILYVWVSIVKKVTEICDIISWGRAISAPPFRRRRFGAGQLGAVPFRRRTFRRRFLLFFYFSNYEEKTMKQAIY